MKLHIHFFKLALSGLALAAAAGARAQLPAAPLAPAPIGVSASNALQPAAASEIIIDASKTGAPINRHIYGQFIEHLGRSIYGGIWAEMLEDRKFYFPVPAPDAVWKQTADQATVLAASPWKVIGPAGTVQMVEKDAFVGRHSPHITASGGGVAAGIYQEDLGLLKGRSYTGYIYLAADGDVAPVTVSLSWGAGGANEAAQTIRSVGSKFARAPFRFTAGADSENGRLAITTSGKGTLKRVRFAHAGGQCGGLPPGHTGIAAAIGRHDLSLAGGQFCQRL